MPSGSEIGKIFYTLNLNDDNFTKGLGTASNQASNFGDTVKNIANKTAIAMGIAGAGLTLYAKNATDFTENFVKSSKSLAREIGTSTTEASRLTAAFSRMGIESDKTQQMFGIFEKRIQASTNATDSDRLAMEKNKIQIEQTQAAIKKITDEISKHGDKTGELRLKLRDLNNTLQSQQIAIDNSASAFQRLGISTTDSSGNQKSFNQILFETADRFKAMPNGIEKTALALDLFGRSGKDMLKVLNLGSAGIQDLEKQADKLGLTLNPNTVVAIEKLVASQKNLKQQTDALKIAVGTATAPVLTEFNTKINEVLQSLMNADGPMKTITTDVLAFGGPVLSGSAALLTFSASMIQGVAAAQEMGLSLTGLAAAGGPFALIGIAAAGAGALIINTSNQTKSAWDNAATAAVNASNSMKIADQEIEDSALSKTDKVRLLNQIADQSNMQSASTFSYVWNYATAGVRNLFDSMVNGVSNALSRLGGIISRAVGSAWNTINGWAGSFYDSGWALISSFANGIAGAVGRAIAAVRGVLSRVRNMLPFSDAKEGPLSDLTKSGQRFSETFASGIMRGSDAIQSAANNALNIGMPSVGSMGSASVSSNGSGNSYQFGDLHFHTAEAVDRFTNYIGSTDRNLQLEGMGLSPM